MWSWENSAIYILILVGDENKLIVPSNICYRYPNASVFVKKM